MQSIADKKKHYIIPELTLDLLLIRPETRIIKQTNIEGMPSQLYINNQGIYTDNLISFEFNNNIITGINVPFGKIDYKLATKNFRNGFRTHMDELIKDMNKTDLQSQNLENHYIISGITMDDDEEKNEIDLILNSENKELETDTYLMTS